MKVTRRLKSLFGGADGPSVDDADPSHVCRSCGNEFYTRPDADIATCRDCGGTKVEQV